MLFTPAPLTGVVVVELEKLGDDRGYFARSWCRREFEAAGLNADLVQCNVSQNVRSGTLRGMHYQTAPAAETKLVRCSRGAIFDVVVDVREASPSFGQWWGLELSPANGKMLYIPDGFAHGFITLADDTEVVYQMSTWYQPALSRGIRWNDPAIGIDWPMEPSMVSERDQALPALSTILMPRK